MNTNNAIGYARVSTDEQTESGNGLTDQRERIAAYCKLKGLNLVAILVDEGISGGKPLASRPKGGKLDKAIRKYGAGAVVVLKLDRAFRNAPDCLDTVEKWERQSISLHLIDLGGNSIDTTTAAGRFMLLVLAGAAEMERNLIRERTRAALAVKKRAGERVGRVPYGFRLHDDGKHLDPVPYEQAIIEEIKTRRQRGFTLQAIADELTRRQIPTQTGAKWTPWSISRIAKRE